MQFVFKSLFLKRQRKTEKPQEQRNLSPKCPKCPEWLEMHRLKPRAGDSGQVYNLGDKDSTAMIQTETESES